MSECIHKEVVTFRTEAGEPVPLWACSKCKTRFEPIGPWMEREKSLQARIEALEKAAKADQQARIESLTEGIKRTTALYNDLENAEIEGDDESCGVIRHQLDRSIEDMAALLEEGE